jgi:hypothetical protein
MISRLLLTLGLAFSVGGISESSTYTGVQLSSASLLTQQSYYCGSGGATGIQGFAEPSVSIYKVESVSTAASYLYLVSVSTLIVPGKSAVSLGYSPSVYDSSATSVSAFSEIRIADHYVSVPDCSTVHTHTADLAYKAFAPVVHFAEMAIASSYSAGITFGYSTVNGFDFGGSVGYSYSTTYSYTDPSFDSFYLTGEDPDYWIEGRWGYDFSQNSFADRKNKSFYFTNVLLVEVMPLYTGLVEIDYTIQYSVGTSIISATYPFSFN